MGPREPLGNIPGPPLFLFQALPSLCPGYKAPSAQNTPSLLFSPSLFLQICEGSVWYHFLQEAFSDAPPDPGVPSLDLRTLCLRHSYSCFKHFLFNQSPPLGYEFFSRKCRDSIRRPLASIQAVSGIKCAPRVVVSALLFPLGSSFLMQSCGTQPWFLT